MSSIDAFMGASRPSVFMAQAVKEAQLKATTLFTPKEFIFDRSAGLADVHVNEYSQLAAADRAAGTYEASMEKLISFAKATRDALKERLSLSMTDEETEAVVGIIGRMNLVLEITTQNFSGGIPANIATDIDSYMREINDLSTQLVNKRTSEYTKAVNDYKKAIEIEQKFSEGYQPYIPGSDAAGSALPQGPTTEEYQPDIPGGGAAGSAGEVITDEGTVEVQQTTMQKFGPVAALAAGGLVAYLALR